LVYLLVLITSMLAKARPLLPVGKGTLHNMHKTALKEMLPILAESLTNEDEQLKKGVTVDLSFYRHFDG